MCAQTRPRFILSSERFWGGGGGVEGGRGGGGGGGEDGVRTHVNSKGKSPLPEKFSAEEDRIHDAASSRTASPTHYQLSYSSPHKLS